MSDRSADNPTVDARTVAAIMDSTLLKPEATRAQVAELIAEATELGCGAVCVSPSMFPVSVGEGQRPLLATVVGFPSGKHASLIKASEARFAVSQGAEEIDMVIDVAAAVMEDESALIADIVAVREAVPHPVALKVIVESAALSESQLRCATRAAATAGADYVKTSTGFHPSGGASVEAVTIMADELRQMGRLATLEECLRPTWFAVGPAAGKVGIKASGGIRNWDAALAMIDAGATRLGVSAAKAILDSGPS